MNPHVSNTQDIPADLQWLSDDLRETAPAAPEHVLGRIHRSLAAVRPLEFAQERQASIGTSRLIGASVRRVAALVLIGVGVWAYVARTHAPRTDSAVVAASAGAPVGGLDAGAMPFEATRSVEWARLLEPWPRAAHAQRGPAAPIPPVIRISDSPRLPEAKQHYQRIRTHPDGTVEQSEWVVELGRVTNTWGRQLYWKSYRYGPMHVPDAQKDVDAVAVQGSDLRPSDRTIRVDGHLRALTFRKDSVRIIERLEGLQSGFAGPNTRPQFTQVLRYDRSRLMAISEDHLALLLANASLSHGWTARVEVPSHISSRIGTYSGHELHMRIAALDTLTVIGRLRHAWRVELLTGAVPDRWWIDRDTGELLRTIVRRSGFEDETRLISSTASDPRK